MAVHLRRWTNPSVIALAGDEDPVSAVTEKARAVVLRALDAGWTGPPFDPVELADLLGIQATPNADIRDARTVPIARNQVRIEFNPQRPRGRLHYSLAHEIAHTLFPDFADTVRDRAARSELKGDDWQLESLCNVAAAELLMPFGAMSSVTARPTDIEHLLSQQKLFDVSTEALFIRTARLSEIPSAMFCSAPIEGGANHGRYRLEYLIGSNKWPQNLSGARGDLLPAETIAARCTAIGFTAKGKETWKVAWGADSIATFDTECVGIPAYPGARLPRVVGMLRLSDSANIAEQTVTYVRGDASRPSGKGRKLIVHVVNDATPNWGGGGFASALRSTHPFVQTDFQKWASGDRRALRLGRVHVTEVSIELTVASIVAQHGYGPSSSPRIRYGALRSGLEEAAKLAALSGSTVHMPRIGCGQAGGSWDLVEHFVRTTFGAAGVRVTVYDPPGVVPAGTAAIEQIGLPLE